MASRKELRAIALQQSKNQLVNALKAEEEKEPDVVRLGAIDPNRGNRTAIFLNNGKASNTIITFNTDPANDTLVRAILGNSYVSLDYVSIFIKKRLPKVIEEYLKKLSYPIITLLGVEGDGQLPITGNRTEFWLTGGKYKKKRIEQLDDLVNRYERNNSCNVAFITNLGNGKYYAATNLYSPVGTIETRGGYYSPRTLKFFKNNQLVTINIDNSQINSSIYTEQMNQDMYYQGNGIWQGIPDNGIYLKLELVVEKGISPFISPLDGYVDRNNYTVFDGMLHTYQGSISLDLDETTYNHFTQGLDAKVITHTTYLPSGNKTFNYTANLIGAPLNSSWLPTFTVPNFKYAENISGEYLVIAWDKKYITQEFEAEYITEVKHRFPGSTPFTSLSYYLFDVYKTSSKTKDVLKLKTFGDVDEEKSITLDSNSKFLVVDMKPIDVITVGSESFTVQAAFVWNELHSETVNILQNYIGENVITSYAIGDKKPYLIRGIIQSVSSVQVTIGNPSSLRHGIYYSVRITINITSKTLLPKTKYSVVDGEYYEDREGIWGLPIPALILDNGCFWNYWALSGYGDFFYNNTDVNVRYPYYESIEGGWLVNESNPFFGDPLNEGYKFVSNNTITIDTYCDLTSPFTPIHPLSAYLLGKPRFDAAHGVLLTDNLVKNKIYSVRNNYHLQSLNNLFVGFGLDKQIKYKQIPVAEWDITDDGKIKYKNTFLANYEMTIPYFEGDPKTLVSSLTVPQCHSYHP